MRGYVAKIAHKRDFRASEFRYFTTKTAARQWVRAKLSMLRGIKSYYRIEPITLQKCRNTWCSRLTTLDQPECLACEKLRYCRRCD